MPKGEKLLEAKQKQKQQTRIKLENAIKEIIELKGDVTVAQIAKFANVSRANIYAHHKDLIENLPKIKLQTTSNDTYKELEKAKLSIKALKNENKDLKADNLKLMDQIVGMKLLLNNKVQLL